MKKRMLSAATAGLLASGCVTAGGVDDALHRMGQRALDETADKAYDSAKEAVTEGPSKRGPEEAGASGSSEDHSGKHCPSCGAPIAGHKFCPSCGQALGNKSGTAAQGRAAIQAGEVYANEFDFIPGDKVLFHEDFSDTGVGEYPVKWTRKDIGGGTSVEVIAEKGKHWLRIAKGATGESDDYIRAEFEDLPKKFTLEFDAYIDPGVLGIGIYVGTDCRLEVTYNGVNSCGGTSTSMPERAGLKHVALSVSDSYLKMYVDGERVLIDADGVKRPIRRLGIRLINPWTPGAPLMLTNLRLAEGGKDYRKDLVNLGRIVTHGITFDTGSDVLKPESGPTLRSILQLLQEDDGLRFEVQGHTDNQGSNKVNQPLSERRAQAVKAWLSKQGIVASRLTTRGLGSTKPIDTNGTSEGRANNRRVEFVNPLFPSAKSGGKKPE